VIFPFCLRSAAAHLTIEFNHCSAKESRNLRGCGGAMHHVWYVGRYSLRSSTSQDSVTQGQGSNKKTANNCPGFSAAFPNKSNGGAWEWNTSAYQHDRPAMGNPGAPPLQRIETINLKTCTVPPPCRCPSWQAGLTNQGCMEKKMASPSKYTRCAPTVHHESSVGFQRATTYDKCGWQPSQGITVLL